MLILSFLKKKDIYVAGADGTESAVFPDTPPWSILPVAVALSQ